MYFSLHIQRLKHVGTGKYAELLVEFDRNSNVEALIASEKIMQCKLMQSFVNQFVTHQRRMYSQFRAIESMLEDCSMRKQTLSNVNKTIMTYLSKVPMKLTSRYKDLSTID